MLGSDTEGQSRQGVTSAGLQTQVKGCSGLLLYGILPTTQSRISITPASPESLILRHHLMQGSFEKVLLKIYVKPSWLLSSDTYKSIQPIQAQQTSSAATHSLCPHLTRPSPSLRLPCPAAVAPPSYGPGSWPASVPAQLPSPAPGLPTASSPWPPQLQLWPSLKPSPKKKRRVGVRELTRQAETGPECFPEKHWKGNVLNGVWFCLAWKMSIVTSTHWCSVATFFWGPGAIP